MVFFNYFEHVFCCNVFALTRNSTPYLIVSPMKMLGRDRLAPMAKPEHSPHLFASAGERIENVGFDNRIFRAEERKSFRGEM